MFRFVMTDKTSQSEKLLENAIQKKPLQQLDLSKCFVYNLIFYKFFLYQWMKFFGLFCYIHFFYNNDITDV